MYQAFIIPSGSLQLK